MQTPAPLHPNYYPHTLVLLSKHPLSLYWIITTLGTALSASVLASPTKILFQVVARTILVTMSQVVSHLKMLPMTPRPHRAKGLEEAGLRPLS